MAMDSFTVVTQQWFPIVSLILIPVLCFLLLIRGKKKKQNQGVKLPPGPPQLPIIGHLHLVGNLPCKSFWKLSQKYGPVMQLQLGRSPPTIVISSPQACKEVMKDNDVHCCSRPVTVGPAKLTYNFLDVAFSPYSDYWKEMRKLFVVELVSKKRVAMFWYAREEQIDKLADVLSKSYPNPVNLTKLVFNLVDEIIRTVTFGRSHGNLEFQQGVASIVSDAMDMLNGFHCEDYFPLAGKFIDRLTGKFAKCEETFRNFDAYFEKVIDEHMDPNKPKPEEGKEDIVDALIGLMKDQTASFHFTRDHVKAIVLDIFLGGTSTSALTITWAFSELIRNPRIMKKAQQEVRGIVGKNAKRVEGSEIEKFTYLKMVLKETFRKHPPLPLLIPHACIKSCKIGGFNVFPGSTVLINAYALGRDPKVWENPEEFIPERFEKSEVDFRGSYFELVPFGAGRRICPALLMATTAVLHTLSNLLYGFDFELPDGMKFEDFPLIETGGITIHNKQDVIVIPKKYQCN